MHEMVWWGERGAGRAESTAETLKGSVGTRAACLTLGFLVDGLGRTWRQWSGFQFCF